MSVMLMTASSVRAADHADAPGAKADPAADITDVYAFRSPENNDNLVVVLNVNPLTAPAMNESTTFADGVSYNIHVANTGDFVADAVVAVTFENDGQEFNITGLGDPITGESSGAATTKLREPGGLRAYRTEERREGKE